MKPPTLRKQHIQSFSRLTISERLAWSFIQNQILASFRDSKARRIAKNIRRYGKRYFTAPNLA